LFEEKKHFVGFKDKALINQYKDLGNKYFGLGIGIGDFGLFMGFHRQK
jgi:hypothetical protein